MVVPGVSVILFFLPPQPCFELHLSLCPCVSPYASADPKPPAKLRLSIWTQPSAHPPRSNISNTETYPWNPNGSEPCPGQLWPFWVLTGERRGFVSSSATESSSSQWLFASWSSPLLRFHMDILTSSSKSVFTLHACEPGHLPPEPFAYDLKVSCLIRPHSSHLSTAPVDSPCVWTLSHCPRHPLWPG